MHSAEIICVLTLAGQFIASTAPYNSEKLLCGERHFLEAPMSNGLLHHVGLEKWWNSTFTKKEQAYIADRYRPEIGSFKNSDGILHKLRHDPGNRRKTLINYKGKSPEITACDLLESMYGHFVPADEDIFKIVKKIQAGLTQRGCK